MEWVATTLVIVTFMWLMAMILYLKSKKVTDLLLVFAVSAILIVFAWLWVSRRGTPGRHEGYVDWNNFVELVNTNSSNPQVSLEAYSFLQDNYNENLSTMSNYLTLYYSAFSKASYPDVTSNMWYNIAPFFRTEGSTKICPDVRIEDTHIKMSHIPTYSREEGMHIGNVALVGAPSNKLGIKAPASFSVFMMLSIMELPEAGTPHELLKIYAHTQNINGLSITLENVNGAPAITVSFGGEMLADKLPIKHWVLRKPVLLVVSKNLQDVSVATFDNLEAVDILALRNEVTMQLPSALDVEFSNKEMVVNSGKLLLINMHAMGFYRSSLTTSRQNDLAVYLAKEHIKMTKYMQQLGATMMSLQQKVIDLKSCKFDQSVCDTCSAVTDWSNMSTVLSQATDACLEAVHKFCTANPEHTFCSCWDTNNPVSSTPKCQNFVKIFSNAGAASTQGVEDIENIDSDTLSIIRDKYNLCDCSATKACANTASDDMAAHALTNVKFFQLTVDTSSWPVSAADIEAYNKIVVENPYVGDIPDEMIVKP